jgi:two-component system response regulator YesN
MKILIVDDEYTARESIKMMLPLEKIQVDAILEADNGLNALDIIKNEKPDIIMMDMKMPEMDGVGLLNLLERQEGGFSIIIISGFTDFEYTRIAIRSKVVDYLLKPIKREELAAAFFKAMENSIPRDRLDDMGKGITSVNSLTKMIKRWIEPDMEEYRKFLCGKGVYDRNGNYIFSILKLTNFEQIIHSSYGSYSVLLFYKLEEAVYSYFKDKFSEVYIKPQQETRELLVLLEYGEEEILLPEAQKDAYLDMLFSGLYKYVYQRFGLESFIAAKRESVNENGLLAAYKEIRHNLKLCNLIGIHKVIMTSGIKVSDMALIHSITVKMNDLYTFSLNNCDMEEALRAIKCLMAGIREGGSISITELEFLCLEFVGMLATIMENAGVHDFIDTLDEKTAMELLQCTCSLDATDAWMCKLTVNALKRMELNRKDAGGNLLADIIRFIDAYYAEKIDLELLSNKFHISREHISRLFKRDFGENFIEYITKVRLNKAVELLKGTNLKLQSISDQTGFSDVSYFSKVFKKQYGLPPADYREARE